MKTHLASLAAAAVLGLGATAAMAQGFERPVREAGPGAYDDLTTGSIAVPGDRPQAGDGWGAIDSAKAGNANQQTRPVPQYGQTSGGPGY